MLPAELAADDAEFVVMEGLLVQMRALKKQLMDQIRDKAPRVYGAKGSRNAADDDDSDGDDGEGLGEEAEDEADL